MPTTLQFRRGTTTQNNAFTGSAGELSIDEQLDVIRVHDGSTAGGAMELTGNTASQTLTNKTLTSPVLNTATVGTSIVPSSADGATLGTASAEFSDLFLADGGTIQLGNDQDVTLTHVADTGILVNSTRKIQFSDAAESIHSSGSRLVLTSNSVAFSMPTADGSSGQAMVTDASGNLSFAAAGATISSDTSTNTDFLIYFASSTSGALTAVKQDSGLIYNPSTGLLTSGAFAGALTGNVTGNASGSSGSCTGNSATATTATTATNVTVADESSDTSCNVLFTTAATGNLGAKSGTNLTFNSSSGQLDATTFNGVATSAQYADLAEKYTTDEVYPPGTIMQVGGDAETTLWVGSPYIAGVISTNPAYLMNSELDGQAIALVGRVPVRVIGSVTKGQAIKADSNGVGSTDGVGPIVGIALETNSNLDEKSVECMLKV